jgi:hypothetical protein
VGQRLLAVDVLAQPHGSDRHDGVIVVGRGHQHRFDVGLLALQHLAPVGVPGGIGVLGERSRRPALVAVAQRHDAHADRRDLLEVVCTAPACPDDGEAQGFCVGGTSRT